VIDSLSAQVFNRQTAAYPRKLTVYLGDTAPSQVNAIGKIGLDNSLALLCSAKAPASVLLAVHDLAQQWRQAERPVISGFHSPVEREALTVLLREPGRTILCPARSLPQRLNPEWRRPLAEGRLTILSPFGAGVKRGTKETAVYRNRVVAALADAILIAYAHPGGSAEQLAREALAWGKPVYALDCPANEGLLGLGVRPYV
jgi:predicted Rossmann fold nucleotide-binding protein DprA/Smf involved in DNA uptake